MRRRNPDVILARLLCLSLFSIGLISGTRKAPRSLALQAPSFRETFGTGTGEPRVLYPTDRLSLKCVASGRPLPTITWTLDGQPVGESHRIQYGDYVSMLGDVVSFVNISSVSRDDAGVYRCSAKNELASHYFEEQVYIGGSPYVKPMQNVTILAGQSVSIKCPVTGYPLDRGIYFKKGGRELPMSERQRIYQNGTLELREATRELDEGQYSCGATNSKGEHHARTFYVLVLKKPVVTAFRFPGNLVEGMSVIVTCSVLEGDPPIKVEWLKDGQKLDTASLNVHRNEMGDLGSSLVFRNIGQSHAGNYSCLARNRVGETIYSAEMAVKLPPRWHIEPADQSAIVGERIKFDCSASGQPAPLVRWKSQTQQQPSSSSSSSTSMQQQQSKQHATTEFKTISSNFRIQALENGSLTIREVSRDDQGLYLCEAGNGIGADLSRVVRLTVHIKPTFKNNLNFQIVRARKGEPFRIVCDASGERPMKTGWTKDGLDIEPNAERYSISTHERQTFNNSGDDGLVSELKAHSASRDDTGAFICSARNAFGKAELTTRLLVEEPPDAPTDLRITDIGSKSCSLKWSAPYSGNVPLSKYVVQWKLDKDPWTLAFSTEISANVAQLFISDLKPLQAYDVRVRAVNTLGESEPSKSVSFNSEEEAPSSAPLGLRVEPVSSSSCKVKWKPPKHIETFGSVTGYYVGYKQLNSDRPVTFKTVDNHHNTKLEVLVTHLKKSTAYAFSVQAFNSKGAGPSSADVVIKTLDKDPPMPPKLRIKDINSHSITLTWSVPDANLVNGYRFFTRASSEGEWRSHEAPSSAGDQSFVLSNLKCGSRYQLYGLAFNEVGSSDPSDTLAFATEGAAPVAPDKASLLTINSTVVTLRLEAWRAQCPINSFEVKIKRQNSNEWTLLTSTLSPLLERYHVPDLEPATWYNLLLGAHSDAGLTEAEYLFATLNEFGGTVAPLSVGSAASGAGQAYSLRQYLQTLMPIVSVFVAAVIVVLLLLLMSFKKRSPMLSGEPNNCKEDGCAMSSKVIYETVRRGSVRENQAAALYGPSPYAASRVSLFFQETPAHELSAGPNQVGGRRDADYDIPIRCHSNSAPGVAQQMFAAGSDQQMITIASDEPITPKQFFVRA